MGVRSPLPAPFKIRHLFRTFCRAPSDPGSALDRAVHVGYPAITCDRRAYAMKLVRYGRLGAEKPGLIDENGALRDLSRVVKDITPAVLSSAGLKKLRAVRTSRCPVVRGRPRLGCPLAGIGKGASASTTPTTLTR